VCLDFASIIFYTILEIPIVNTKPHLATMYLGIKAPHAFKNRYYLVVIITRGHDYVTWLY
jgi:hypothetical protein